MAVFYGVNAEAKKAFSEPIQLPHPVMNSLGAIEMVNNHTELLRGVNESV